MEETQDLQGFRKPCPRRFRVINVRIGSGWENLTGIFTDRTKLTQRIEDLMPSGRFGAIVAGLAVFAIAGGLVAGCLTSDNEPKNNIFAQQNVTPQNGLPVLPPGDAQNGQGSIEVDEEKAQDYSLDKLSLGKTGKNYKELGASQLSASTLPFTVRGHTYNVVIPETMAFLYSSGTDIDAVVQNYDVDSQTNFVIKKVLVNQESLEYGVRLSKALPKVEAVLPADVMEEKKINVCDSYPVIGCEDTATPKEYALSAKETALYQYSAQILALRALQAKCAPEAFKARITAINAYYDKQATKKGVNADFVTAEFVNAAGEVSYFEPNHVDKKIAEYVAKGGTDNDAKLKKMFGEVPAISVPICNVSNTNSTDK